MLDSRGEMDKLVGVTVRDLACGWQKGWGTVVESWNWHRMLDSRVDKVAADAAESADLGLEQLAGSRAELARGRESGSGY